MAGEYGEGIAYKGLTMHKAKRWHTVTGKGLCAVMWAGIRGRAMMIMAMDKGTWHSIEEWR